MSSRSAFGNPSNQRGIQAQPNIATSKPKRSGASDVPGAAVEVTGTPARTFAEWAAAKLGIMGDQLQDYVRSVVKADLEIALVWPFIFRYTVAPLMAAPPEVFTVPVIEYVSGTILTYALW